MTSDGALLDAWWREFESSGQVPAALEVVQTRLIRSVHRAALPSGEVFVKTMTFPRAKDRLRYAFRALPAQNEAAMLRAVAAANVPCPEVVEVRTARRFCLPYRSWLVLRALPVAAEAEAESPLDRLRDQAALALALLEAGIVHRDLHDENFVRLADGRLAILDLQSVRQVGRPATDERSRLAAAARLVRDMDDWGLVADALVASGLVPAAALERVRHLAAAERAAHWRRRVMRCLGETTEFGRRVRLHGVEHAHRTKRPPGRWWHGGAELREAWIGQRAHCLFGSRSPVFWALFQKWWWLGGGCALYVPKTCLEDRIELECAAARGGVALLAKRTETRGEGQDGGGQKPTESGRVTG